MLTTFCSTRTGLRICIQLKGRQIRGPPWQACPDAGEQRQDGHGQAISHIHLYAMPSDAMAIRVAHDSTGR